jgi:hypothetical protein
MRLVIPQHGFQALLLAISRHLNAKTSACFLILNDDCCVDVLGIAQRFPLVGLPCTGMCVDVAATLHEQMSPFHSYRFYEVPH